MKSLAIVLICVLGSMTSRAQENLLSISGGYSFANVEDVDANATGWRINGTYEYNHLEGKFSHGVSFGYISTSAMADTIGGGTTEYKFGTWPIYYAPKFLIGSGSAKGFVKGALGWQFSTFDRTSALLQTEANDSGFLGGLGVGFMKIFNDKIFINAEYEWTYMSNSFYRDGFMNSIMGGIGIMF